MIALFCKAWLLKRLVRCLDFISFGGPGRVAGCWVGCAIWCSFSGGVAAGNFVLIDGARGAGGGFRDLLELTAAPDEAFGESEDHERLKSGLSSDMDRQETHAALDSCSYDKNATSLSQFAEDAGLVGCKAEYFDPYHLMMASCSDSLALGAQIHLVRWPIQSVWPLRVTGNVCTHAGNCSLAMIEGLLALSGSSLPELAGVHGHRFDCK